MVSASILEAAPGHVETCGEFRLSLAPGMRQTYRLIDQSERGEGFQVGRKRSFRGRVLGRTRRHRLPRTGNRALWRQHRLHRDALRRSPADLRRRHRHSLARRRDDPAIAGLGRHLLQPHQLRAHLWHPVLRRRLQPHEQLPLLGRPPARGRGRARRADQPDVRPGVPGADLDHGGDAGVQGFRRRRDAAARRRRGGAHGRAQHGHPGDRLPRRIRRQERGLRLGPDTRFGRRRGRRPRPARRRRPGDPQYRAPRKYRRRLARRARPLRDRRGEHLRAVPP